ncbi:hypothetical protein AAG570_011785 [Ranatra chinensis]|uniref:Uncharacterized protein n=1 Tax=Ranatra chinensis TaxID=642074 RepID=A0ABD0YHC8_9HEMI
MAFEPWELFHKPGTGPASYQSARRAHRECVLDERSSASQLGKLIFLVGLLCSAMLTDVDGMCRGAGGVCLRASLRLPLTATASTGGKMVRSQRTLGGHVESLTLHWGTAGLPPTPHYRRHYAQEEGIPPARPRTFYPTP